MERKLRAGVIGLGMGCNHVRGYRNHPDVELVAVADIDPERLQERGVKDLKVPACYSSAEEMLEKEQLDIVSVAVPNCVHKDLTIKALKAGANVLCEKPMAMNEAESVEMMETAKKCNRKLGINFSYRFLNQSREMKKIVDQGGVGEIYYAQTNWFRRKGIPGLEHGNFNSPGAAGRWFFDKEMSGGGPLIDLGVHRLDFCLWMMGYPEPEWVMGSTYDKLGPRLASEKNRVFTVEDLAASMIRFKNGSTLQIVASWASHVKEQELMNARLLGTEGGLLQFNIHEGYEFRIEHYFDRTGQSYDSMPHDLPAETYLNSYYEFADAVAKDKPFLVRPEEGVTVMRILDAIYESARTGTPVKLG